MESTQHILDPDEDHFHLAIHVTLPSLASSTFPSVMIGVGRYKGQKVVEDGPRILAVLPDIAYPDPGIEMREFAMYVVRLIEETYSRIPKSFVDLRPETKIKESLIAPFIPDERPLW